MKLAVIAGIALLATLWPQQTQSADPCSYTFEGDLPANSTLILNMTVDCTGWDRAEYKVWKPKPRTLPVELRDNGLPIAGITLGDSETRLAGGGGVPVGLNGTYQWVLANDGAKMNNVKLTLRGYDIEP